MDFTLILIQLLFITASLWLMTAWIPAERNYFKSITIGFSGFSIMLVIGYWTLKINNPDALTSLSSNPVALKLLKGFPLSLDQMNRRLLPIAIAVLMVDILFIYVRRTLVPKYQEWWFKRKRRLMQSKKNKTISQVKSVQEYFKPGYYFLGNSGDGSTLLDRVFGGHSDKGLIYLTPQELILHGQVVGPSGCGKTESILFPLSMQAIKNGVSTIFIDGKGDSELIRRFTAQNNAVAVFDPLNPEHSNSYNPLCSVEDPQELMNLVAVGLNLDAPGEAKVYTDIQKKYLASLLSLFISTGKSFSFIDILEFTNYELSRDFVYALNSSQFYIEEMKNFIGRLSKNQRELIGLSVQVDSLFTADEKISSIINDYDPDINFKDVFLNKGNIIASFSTGKKAQTNESLAKMMLADIANAIGERQSKKENPFCLLILDEFGQYVPDHFDKFISTCRSANVGVVLSHQTNAQLESREGSDRLAKVVRENTSTKIIFRQSEEASFWSECFGTKSAFKHTDQTEESQFGTQKISKMGSIREVDEFIIHPNTLRQLDKGQSIFKSGHGQPMKINCSMWKMERSQDGDESRCYGEWCPCKRKNGVEGGQLKKMGLNLREKRLATLHNSLLKTG